MLKILGYLSFLVLIVSCSHSMKRTDLGEAAGSVTPETAVETDEEIKKTLALKPNLPKPFRMGVYFKPLKDEAGYKWRWSESDKSSVESALENVKATLHASAVFRVEADLISGADLRAVRLAAAKEGADAVLVVEGSSEMNSQLNSLGWTYFLLVPTLFVHGTDGQVIFTSKASLWDVRNEYLYLLSEAEGEKKDSYAPVAGQPAEALIDAKTTSLENLKSELIKSIKGI